MNAKRRWYELLLPGVVMLLVITAGTVKTANAQYAYIQGDWEGTKYESPDYWWSTSSYIEYANAYSNPNELTGVCDCDIYVQAKAKDDYAVADADSYAYLQTDWTWNGPPESAPGGYLTWIQDASGSVTAAWGYNTETATSSSEASTGSWSGGTEGSAYADVEVWGYIEDGETADGDTSTDADPFVEFDEGTVTEYDTPPDYVFSVDGWSFSTGDTEVIASGTTYIYFAGGIDCEALAATTNTGTTYWSHAGADASAEVQVSAVFESN
jgi:hypothetical protein